MGTKNEAAELRGALHEVSQRSISPHQLNRLNNYSQFVEIPDVKEGLFQI